jgi:predicted nucleic acid-binding Zn ribbon protein
MTGQETAMRYEYSPLQQDADCPFCATELPEGASVCTGCGAIYVVKRRVKRMAIGFFLVGLYIGRNLSSDAMFLFALALGAVGAWAVNRSDTRRPFWLRAEP